MALPPLKFSANLGFLWTELSLPDAIYAAAAAGFDAVECHWPYTEDPAVIARVLAETGLPMLSMNTGRGGDGLFGLTALPHQQIAARDAIMAALDYAAATGTKAVHAMAGCSAGQDAKIVFLENLAFASAAAADRNITILIEPINTIDVPEYFLTTPDQAAAIIKAVDHPSLRMMFDCYHVAMMGGDVIEQLKRYLPIVGHIQFAGVPTRGWPDEGQLDYYAIFNAIQKMAWDKPLGAEYKPGGKTKASLRWLSQIKKI